MPFSHFNDLEEDMSHAERLYMPKVEQNNILASHWYIMCQNEGPQSSFIWCKLRQSRATITDIIPCINLNANVESVGSSNFVHFSIIRFNHYTDSHKSKNFITTSPSTRAVSMRPKQLSADQLLF